MGSISGNHEAEIGRWRAPRRRDFCAAYACSEAAFAAARKFLSDGCRNDRCREREGIVGEVLQFEARAVLIEDFAYEPLSATASCFYRRRNNPAIEQGGCSD